MKKPTVDQLTRLAFIYAEQDRATMAQCDGGEEGKKAAELAKWFAAYRKKRWGKIVRDLEDEPWGGSIDAMTGIPAMQRGEE